MFNLNISNNNLCCDDLFFLKDIFYTKKEGLIGGKELLVSKKKSKKEKIGRTGIVISVSDELIECSGLSKAKYGELVVIKKNKKTYFGLVLNIS